jgi:uncharacterized protein
MADEAKAKPGMVSPVCEGWRGDLLLIGIAGLGGAVFALLGIPAAWLSGAMIAVLAASTLVAAKTRARLAPMRPQWFDVTMLLSGTLIGAAATPEAVAATARYPGSIALLVIALFAIMAATSFYLRRFAGWAEPEATLASAPGALSAVLAIAVERNADIPRIAIVQVFRLFILVAALPGVLVASGLGAGGPAIGPSVIADPLNMAVMLGAGLGLGLVLQRLGMTAPLIVGATLASAVLHGLGLVHGTLPGPVAIFAFVLLGAMVAGRIATIDAHAFRRVLPAALGAFIVSMAVAALFAWPAALLAGVPYATALVAFAPGGLEAMAMLAFALGLDPLYVGAHHLVRFVAIGLILPPYIGLVGKILLRGGSDEQD